MQKVMWRQTLLGGALALACAQAGAVVVDLDFEVTPTERFVDTTVDSVTQHSVLEAGPLANFSFKVRFDTDRVPNAPGIPMLWIEGVEVSQTPYTAGIEALIPPDFASLGASGNLQYMSLNAAPDGAERQRFWMGFDNGSFNVEDGYFRYSGYTRAIQWPMQTPAMLAGEGIPPTVDEWMSYLENLKGQTLSGAFKESFSQDMRLIIPLPSDTGPLALTLVSGREEGVGGNVVLRSITTAVPEPSTWMLWLSGGVALAAAMRRHRAGTRSAA